MLQEWQCWKNWNQFCALPKEEREIVFYSESQHYWTHFVSIIHNLTNIFNQKICYLTSDKNDPIFKRANKNIKAFWIGHQFVRNLAFRQIDAQIVIMSMPDLENFYLKRSIHAVHYIYMFHSLVSTHRIYNHSAFDHYDTLFCCGPHHIQEIQEAERLYSLKHKKIFKFGYSRLDDILQNLNSEKGSHDSNKILIAPSWGERNIITDCAMPLVSNLLQSGYEVIFRPHPQSCKYQKQNIQQILKAFSSHQSFYYDIDMNSSKSLLESALMISDWSGAALDYAFGFLKPVLFIDVPPKINNTHFEDFKSPAIEASLRTVLGEVLGLNKMDQAVNQVRHLISNYHNYQQNIEQARNQYVFNLGKSGYSGAKYIVDLLGKDNESIKEKNQATTI